MKADLNLLPKKQSNISAKNLVILSVISIIVLGLVGYFFVYIPNEEKNRISKEIEEKQEELAKYEGLDEELAQLNIEIADLKGMLEAVGGITSEYVKMTEKLEAIEEAMPVDIILNKFSYSENIINITGQGPDDKDAYTHIARFMVNLRNIEDVEKVSLSSVNYDEKEEQEGQVFEITINYGEKEESLEEVPEDEILDEEGEE